MNGLFDADIYDKSESKAEEEENAVEEEEKSDKTDEKETDSKEKKFFYKRLARHFLFDTFKG